MLTEELKEYVNPAAKIRRLAVEGKLFPVVRGLYETDGNIPGYYLAPVIYGPSYLSFEFALAYYSLIPEEAVHFTSATFEKKKTKRFKTPFGLFTYRDVPGEAYPFGVVFRSENGYGFAIATPEKAICDMLYTVSPVRNKIGLEQLLFFDLRIDKAEFFRLIAADLLGIAGKYHTQNHKLLQAYLKRSIKNGPDDRTDASSVQYADTL